MLLRAFDYDILKTCNIPRQNLVSSLALILDKDLGFAAVKMCLGDVAIACISFTSAFVPTPARVE